MVEVPLAESLLGRAVERGLLDVRVRDLRDYTDDRHRVVDDVPVRGRPGHGAEGRAAVPGGGRDSRRAGRAGRRGADLAAGPAVRAPRGGAAQPPRADCDPLRPLRGRGRARPRAPRDRGAVDRRLRADGRRVRRAGHRRRGGPARAGRGGRRPVGRLGIVRAGVARLSALHAAGGVPVAGRAAGAALGAPRGDRPLAQARGRQADARAPAGAAGRGGARRGRAPVPAGVDERRRRRREPSHERHRDRRAARRRWSVRRSSPAIP